jgi:hypothetical protein
MYVTESNDGWHTVLLQIWDALEFKMLPVFECGF